jgi:hypothetical protein
VLIVSSVLIKSIMTACSTPLLVIVAATSFRLLLGEFNETCPPIIWNGATSAIDSKALLAKVVRSNLIVSTSANADEGLPGGDVVVIVPE